MSITKGLRWFFANVGKLRPPVRGIGRLTRPLVDDAVRLGLRSAGGAYNAVKGNKTFMAFRAGSKYGRKHAIRRLGQQIKVGKPSTSRMQRTAFGVGRFIPAFRLERAMRPTLRNSTKVGKLAFRGEVGASVLAGAGAVWAANSYRKDIATFRKQSAERDKALEAFKRSLKAPTKKRARRIK